MMKVTILIDGGIGRVFRQRPPVVIPDILNRGSSVFSLVPRPLRDTNNQTGFPLTNGGNDGFGISMLFSYQQLWPTDAEKFQR